MSLPFSDTATKKGIIQEIESECGLNDGDISSNTTLLKKFTAGVNLTLDDFTKIAIQSSGKWQFDDSNQTSYPIITANLISGQRDYPIVSDTEGNLILDFLKILVADSAGVFHEVDPVDAQSDKNTDAFWDGRNTSGMPCRYDKTANGIFFDLLPSYSYTNGIKAYVNREGLYFTSADTTKKPGVPGILHRYFVVKPSMEYARRKGLESYAGLAAEVLKYEGDEERGIIGSIARYYGKRAKDERNIMTPKKILYI